MEEHAAGWRDAELLEELGIEQWESDHLLQLIDIWTRSEPAI
jgi:hypothetical protein